MWFWSDETKIVLFDINSNRFVLHITKSIRLSNWGLGQGGGKYEQFKYQSIFTETLQASARKM